MVVGAFGDYDFSDIKGNHSLPGGFGTAREKLRDAWAVGGRLGVLVTPSLLTYFSGGYTEARFDQQNYFLGFNPPIATGTYTGSQTYRGYFIGAGDEYALNFLPGLFWKSEYRFSEFQNNDNAIRLVATGARTGFIEDSKKYVHTVRSELVYRFNWGGSAVVAKY